jgi:hypothetical protein
MKTIGMMWLALLIIFGALGVGCNGKQPKNGTEVLKEVVEFDWSRPQNPPDWWLDLGNWRKANEGEWVVGVSGLHSSQADAKEKARDNALTVHLGEVLKEQKLEEHNSYLRVYKSSTRGALYEVSLLFKVPEPGMVVTGMAVITSGDEEMAKKAAINEALRNAVRIHLGSHIGGSDAARHSGLTDSRLRAKVSDVVTTHKVLDLKTMNGTVYARIRATVDAIKLDALDLARVRVAVLAGGAHADKVHQTMVSSLKKAGFSVVDLNVSGVAKMTRDELASTAKKHSVDLVVQITASTREKDKFGQFLLYTAELDGTAFKPFSNEVLVTRRIAADGKRLLQPDTAELSALESALEAAGDYFPKEIARHAPGLSELLISVQGLRNRSQLDSLRQELLGKPGMRDVEVCGYEGRSGLLRVKVDPDVKDMVGAYIEQLKGIRLQITKQMVDGLEVSVNAE